MNINSVSAYSTGFCSPFACRQSPDLGEHAGLATGGHQLVLVKAGLVMNLALALHLSCHGD